ncbi:hypothetical protein YC2023_107634 [Brassica napus]
MSKGLLLSGKGLQPTTRLVLRLLSVTKERHQIVNNVGTRLMTKCASFVERMKQQPERKPVVKTRMLFSNMLSKSSSTTIKRSSPLNMLGRRFAITRSGVTCLHLQVKEAPKGGSVRTVHI